MVFLRLYYHHLAGDINKVSVILVAFLLISHRKKPLLVFQEKFGHAKEKFRHAKEP